MPFPAPDGQVKLGHAELQFGDSRVFLADEFPQQGGFGPGATSPVTMHMYVTDVDAAFARAVEAGAKAIMPLADMFWGDRYGLITDPFGHSWSLATHKEDLTAEELKERAQAAFGGCTQ